MVSIIPLDRNLILKIYIIDQELQLFIPSSNSLNYLMFLILALFMTTLLQSLTSQNLLCIFASEKTIIESNESNMIYDRIRRKMSLSSVTFYSSWLIILTQIKLDKVVPQKFLEKATIVPSLFTRDFISCIVILKLWSVIWEESQSQEMEAQEFSLKTESEIFPLATRTTVA